MENTAINGIQTAIVRSLRKAPNYTIVTADIGTFRHDVGLRNVSNKLMFIATLGLRGRVLKIKKLETGQTQVRLRQRYR